MRNSSYMFTEDDPNNPGKQLDIAYSVSLFLIRHEGAAPTVDTVLPTALNLEQSGSFSTFADFYTTIIADLIAGRQAEGTHQHASQPTVSGTGGRQFFRVVEYQVDTDGDSIYDSDELAGLNPSSPYLWDTDRDGVGDADERARGTHSNDASDAPPLTPAFWRESNPSYQYEEQGLFIDENDLNSWTFGAVINFSDGVTDWIQTTFSSLSLPAIEALLPPFTSSGSDANASSNHDPLPQWCLSCVLTDDDTFLGDAKQKDGGCMRMNRREGRKRRVVFWREGV
jgi:hypothetical protein